MALETFIGATPPAERKAFKFGHQKINLHVGGKEFEPKANAPTPGPLDLCFISTLPLVEAIGRLQECGWPIIEGQSCAQAQRNESSRYISVTLMAT